MTRARDLADSADKDIVGTITVDGLTVAGNVSVDSGTIKLDGNYPVGTQNVALGGDTFTAIDAGANYNTALGYRALEDLTTGDQNTAVGRQALAGVTTGSNNTAFGMNAADSTTSGGSNVAVGRDALQANTTANNNTAVGYQALNSNTTGTSNVALGSSAGQGITTGSNNIAIGKNAINSTSTGNNNTAVGNAALNTTTGSDNSGFGKNVLDANTSGSYNTAVGSDALGSNTTASNNTAVGHQAAYSNTTGANNTSLGWQAAYSTTTAGDNTALGNASLYANSTGAYNTAVGRQALRNNTTADDNTAVGYQAGYTNTTGQYNTFVGKAAGYNSNVAAGRNTFVGMNSGYYVSSGDSNTILGRYTGNQGGLDIRTSSNNIVLSDGDGNPRLTVNSNGTVSSGKYTSLSDGQTMADFGFSGSNNTCSFRKFSCGPDTDRTGMRWDLQGVNNERMWVDDTGDLRMHGADPTSDTSGAVVGTQTFSGTHIYKTDETDLVIGEAVCLSGTKIVRSNSAMSKTCVGIYAGESGKKFDSFGQECRDVDNNPVNGVGHAVIALGDTRFKQNGNQTIGVLVDGSVTAGDLLCTSSTAGKLTVQSDDIIRSYTVAKAMENGDENNPVYAYIYSG
jgi:hypothetical protein